MLAGSTRDDEVDYEERVFGVIAHGTTYDSDLDEEIGRMQTEDDFEVDEEDVGVEDLEAAPLIQRQDDNLDDYMINEVDLAAARAAQRRALRNRQPLLIGS